MTSSTWEATDDLPASVALRRRSYALLADRPAGPVLDVGCGSGRALGELVHAGADALGLEPDAGRAAVARARGLTVLDGTAEDVPLPASSVAAWRAERLLHLLSDPHLALAEARRVLRPGGPAILVTQHWAGTAVDSGTTAAEGVWAAVLTGVPAPRAALASRALLLDAGFTDVSVEVVVHAHTDGPAAGAVEGMAEAARRAGVDGVDAWLLDQRERIAQGRFLLAIPFVVVSGRAPA